MADTGAGNWIPGVVIALSTPLLLKWLELRGTARKETLEARAKEAQLLLEREKIGDASDAELIKNLMSERKDYQEEIRNLRAEAAAERVRCDMELDKLRKHFEIQIANLEQFYKAEIELLKIELMEKIKRR